jgi:hypothetical protein
MRINRHEQHATAELTIALTTAGAPRQPDLTERTVIATAGAWHPATGTSMFAPQPQRAQ